MRHRKQNTKFGRSKSHREALIPMLVVGLIKAMSIQTTVQNDLFTNVHTSAISGIALYYAAITASEVTGDLHPLAVRAVTVEDGIIKITVIYHLDAAAIS